MFFAFRSTALSTIALAAILTATSLPAQAQSQPSDLPTAEEVAQIVAEHEKLSLEEHLNLVCPVPPNFRVAGKGESTEEAEASALEQARILKDGYCLSGRARCYTVYSEDRFEQKEKSLVVTRSLDIECCRCLPPAPQSVPQQ